MADVVVLQDLFDGGAGALAGHIPDKYPAGFAGAAWSAAYGAAMTLTGDGEVTGGNNATSQILSLSPIDLSGGVYVEMLVSPSASGYISCQLSDTHSHSVSFFKYLSATQNAGTTFSMGGSFVAPVTLPPGSQSVLRYSIRKNATDSYTLEVSVDGVVVYTGFDGAGWPGGSLDVNGPIDVLLTVDGCSIDTFTLGTFGSGGPTVMPPFWTGFALSSEPGVNQALAPVPMRAHAALRYAKLRSLLATMNGHQGVPQASNYIQAALKAITADLQTTTQESGGGTSDHTTAPLAVSGTHYPLTAGAQGQWFKWNAKASVKYGFSILGADGTNGVGGALVFFNPDGTMTDGGSTLALVSRTVPSDGVYYAFVLFGSATSVADGWVIEASGTIPSGVEFVLTDASVMASGHANAAPVGLPYSAAFTSDAMYEWVSFEATAGAAYRISTTDFGDPAVVDTSLAVFDSNGNLLGFNDDASGNEYRSELTVTPNASGTLYVFVAGTFGIAAADGWSVNLGNSAPYAKLTAGGAGLSIAAA